MEAEGLDPMGEARGSHVQTMGIYERGGGGKIRDMASIANGLIPRISQQNPEFLGMSP